MWLILVQSLRMLCFGLSPIVLSLKTPSFFSIFLKLNLLNQVDFLFSNFPQNWLLLFILNVCMICYLGALATGGEETLDKHTASKAYQKVSTLRNICELKRPEVNNMSLHHTIYYKRKHVRSSIYICIFLVILLFV